MKRFDDLFQGILKRNISRVLKREWSSSLRSRYIIASVGIGGLILVTAIPAYCIGGWQLLGQTMSVVGALIVLLGTSVALYPAIRGYHESYESEVASSLENYRQGMQTLEEEKRLDSDQTGHEEAFGVLVDQYDVDVSMGEELPTIGIQNDSGGKGMVELKTQDVVTLDGEPVITSRAPVPDRELLFPMFRDQGERYAKKQIEIMEDKREARGDHFHLLSTYIVLIGTGLTLVGVTLTATALLQTLSTLS